MPKTLLLKVMTHILRYSGRIVMLDDAAELSWSASSVKINFKGTGAKAL